MKSSRFARLRSARTATPLNFCSVFCISASVFWAWSNISGTLSSDSRSLVLQLFVAHDRIDAGHGLVEVLQGEFGLVDDAGQLIVVGSQQRVHAAGQLADFRAGRLDRIERRLDCRLPCW